MSECALVLGATSLVGQRVLPHLAEAGWAVVAASRRSEHPSVGGLRWVRVPGPLPSADVVLSLAPVWATASCLAQIDGAAPRRVVALSSTSVITKQASRDGGDQALARRLADGEAEVRAWCDAHGVEWVLLRPTLIYGGGLDRNVSDIARLIRRVGVFPLVGGGHGLRQPVHRDDVASACVSALTAAAAPGHCYVLSGGERLAYGEMVRRIFAALGRTPRTPPVPVSVARALMLAARLLPRYRVHSLTVIDRMLEDLVFDHEEAARDLGFVPRPFSPTAADIGC
jgi:nucleoside-diphosphate-sugar epimerase